MQPPCTEVICQHKPNSFLLSYYFAFYICFDFCFCLGKFFWERKKIKLIKSGDGKDMVGIEGGGSIYCIKNLIKIKSKNNKEENSLEI